jgi:2,3-bisphosphoglycerate-dependent phosphoglycerate mutase
MAPCPSGGTTPLDPLAWGPPRPPSPRGGDDPPKPPRKPAVLVLLRHGESEWNAKDLFTGWIDVGLSERGRAQAVAAGEEMANRGMLPDVVHTSVQRRAIRTADLALEACGRLWIPVRRSWRLNSNHYGALQGRVKARVRAEAGAEQFMRWRRGYDVRPPLGEGDDDPRYTALPPEERPRGESLRDVTARLLPYWYDAIVPDLRRHACVLVVSHGNTLRALVKHLEGVSDADSSALTVPNAVPVPYNISGPPEWRAARA